MKIVKHSFDGVIVGAGGAGGADIVAPALVSSPNIGVVPKIPVG